MGRVSGYKDMALLVHMLECLHSKLVLATPTHNNKSPPTLAHTQTIQKLSSAHKKSTSQHHNKQHHLKCQPATKSPAPSSSPQPTHPSPNTTAATSTPASPSTSPSRTFPFCTPRPRSISSYGQTATSRRASPCSSTLTAATSAIAASACRRLARVMTGLR